MTPAWPWALALTIALGALIVSQVQLREARGEVHRLRALLSDVTKGTLRQLEQAEAAIARVRELHRQSHFSNECIECAPGGTYYWPCPTVEALADGAS